MLKIATSCKRRRAARDKDAELRTRLEVALDGITLPYAASMETVLAALSQLRQRPIHVHVMPDTQYSCGLFVRSPRADHIFVAPTISAAQHEMIVRHELAHMLLGHEGIDPRLPAELITERTVLARTSYESAIEREAEIAGTWLPEILAGLASAPAETSSRAFAARVDAALSHPRKNRAL
jgi:hypothetical protein